MTINSCPTNYITSRETRGSSYHQETHATLSTQRSHCIETVLLANSSLSDPHNALSALRLSAWLTAPRETHATLSVLWDCPPG